MEFDSKIIDSYSSGTVSRDQEYGFTVVFKRRPWRRLVDMVSVRAGDDDAHPRALWLLFLRGDATTEREENNFFRRMRYDIVYTLRRSQVKRSDYTQSRKKGSRALRWWWESGVAQAGTGGGRVAIKSSPASLWTVSPPARLIPQTSFQWDVECHWVLAVEVTCGVSGQQPLWSGGTPRSVCSAHGCRSCGTVSHVGEGSRLSSHHWMLFEWKHAAMTVEPLVIL